MKKNDPQPKFSSLEERQKAIEMLEEEIQRTMGDIDKGYSRLGRCYQAVTEQEMAGINELTDKVVVLKQKLRKLRENV